ncbi:MAG: hypothetical protein DWQ34_04465 [Planctomycetota bacterium]|nr:MAG: hypothetical protein DWQ29_24065 [Planctomycetota bacterium]REJ96292.1 MAG: hypothetical protein DWQ34_04465 [Planctomycetota bacterium]REK22242.1 MAG: hypothetical protein DWQ41_19420 [Planctomycetota bacterium]REK27425.1 MAG: hypothetical protein DWQ45_25340 [Planctomycetota bacterium]
MISEHTQSVARRAKAIYAEKLQSQLEREFLNQFVAIEPESEEYFLAESFSKAVAAARMAHPERISFVIRIGHEAALHIGGAAK